MKYSLWIDGKATGPYDARQIQNLYADGVISDTDMVNPDGSKSWPMLKEVFPVDTWKSGTGSQSGAGRLGALFSRSVGQGEVTIVGVNIPFWDLVLFLLKLMAAGFLAGLVFSIPYLIFWGLVMRNVLRRVIP